MGLLRPPEGRRLHEITTQWSLLAAIRDPAGTETSTGWENLLDRYHAAMAAYVRAVLERRRGRPAREEDVSDTLQDFLAACVAKGWLTRARPGEGRRFRAFLMTLLDRFVKDSVARERARKRSPATGTVVSLEASGADPADLRDGPEEAFHRRFAERTVALALERLEASNARYAAVIRGLLSGADAEPVTPWLRSRARARFRDCFLALLRESVRDPGDLPEEWRGLAPWLP